MNGRTFELPRPIEAMFERVRTLWGWYFALGVALVALGIGAAAFAYYTTVASVAAFGWILMFAGVALGLLSFLIGRWSGFLLSLSAGILSAVTGMMLLRAPVSGAVALTLLVASFLLVSGMFRAIASVVMRFPNWGWSAFSGIVGVMLGTLLFASWPEASLWFLGFVVGVDLIVHGISWMSFSAELHRQSRRLGITQADRHAAD